MTKPTVITVPEHTVEVVSDSGEGAQKCGQSFGAVCAQLGNGAWTVEIIPAEIQPPARTPGSASGVRIRIGTDDVTNWGDEAHVVLAFNEQVLLARHRLGALADDAVILIENFWEDHEDEKIRQEWKDAMEELSSKPYKIIGVPMEVECLKVVDDTRRGKNMFGLGVLAGAYGLDIDAVRGQVAHQFRKKSQEIVDRNFVILEAGVAWAEENLDFRIDVPPTADKGAQIVVNGNTAIGMGAVAAGLELCAMYPITPATSVSHYLGEIFDRVGGIVHQAEDEIAAVGAAIGASYAGRCAFTVTSGPGMALKTEFLGLATMLEIPLVVVNVQRGGPSTGLPTKVEQSDLLAAAFGQPGDAPKVILAPATIEECFHCMVTARRIAEALRCVVFVLTDANLATGVTPFARPVLDPGWMAGPPDLGPVPEGMRPYEWDDATGLSRRFIPGSPGGMHTVTGLAHTEESKVSYTPAGNQRGNQMRSRKIAVFQKTLQTPPIYGEDSGDLLVVGWGSTKGAIEEAVRILGEKGHKVSSTHLTFVTPLPSGLKEMFQKFKKVITVEINYSDDPEDPNITPDNRRLGQLCYMLRAQTLVDVDCWTRVQGEPLRPGRIVTALEKRLAQGA